MGDPLIDTFLCVQKILDTKGLFQGVEFENWLKQQIRGNSSQDKTVRDLRAWMSLKDIQFSVREGVPHPSPPPDLSTVGKTDVASCTSFREMHTLPPLLVTRYYKLHRMSEHDHKLENYGPIMKCT
jgi:hypothetical protein